MGASAGSTLIQVQGVWLPEPDPAVKEPVAAKDIKPGGVYELPLYEACMKRCQRRRLAVDVGAHVGTWTRLLARDFERVAAFEPYPPFFECLKRNVQSKNTVLHPEAVGDHSGPAQLALGTLHPPRVGSAGLGVRMSALDDLDLLTVDFIKIDVEGYEFAVLTGAVDIIERDHPVVRLEQHPRSTPMDYGFGWTAAIDFLTSRGAMAEKIGKVDWLCWWPT